MICKVVHWQVRQRAVIWAIIDFYTLRSFSRFLTKFRQKSILLYKWMVNYIGIWAFFRFPRGESMDFVAFLNYYVVLVPRSGLRVDRNIYYGTKFESFFRLADNVSPIDTCYHEGVVFEDCYS